MISVAQFNRALSGEQTEFTQLRGAKISTQKRALALSHRTTTFLQSAIEWQNGHYLLLLPIDNEAIEKLKLTISNLLRSGLEIQCPYSILSGEYNTLDAFDRAKSYDLALQKLVDGELLSDFLDELYQEIELRVLEQKCRQLFAAIQRLEQAFTKAGVCHNNLKINNIIIDAQGELHPIRYEHATFKNSADKCKAEFDALREIIALQLDVDPSRISQQIVSQSLKEIELTDIKIEGGEFEGLRLFFAHGLYGYVDNKNQPVIAAQFSSAEKFREDRAVVVDKNKRMGMINSGGKYILECIYDDIYFHVESACARVRMGEKWALFDYFGEQITPLIFDYIKEDEVERILEQYSKK